MLTGELTFPNFWAAQTKVFNHGVDWILRSIGITLKQGFDKIQRNEGEVRQREVPIKGIRGGGCIDLKGGSARWQHFEDYTFSQPFEISPSSQMEGFLDPLADYYSWQIWILSMPTHAMLCHTMPCYAGENSIFFKECNADNMYWRIFPPSYFQSENFVGSYKLILM